MDIQVSMDYSSLLFDQQEFYDTYLLCKSFFDNQEYQRYAHFLFSTHALEKVFHIVIVVMCK